MTESMLVEMRGLYQQLDPAWRQKFAATLPGRLRNLPQWERWHCVNNETKWLTALHEAGHCAAAWVVESTVESVSAISDGHDSHGRTRIRLSAAESDYPALRIIGLLTGPLAESELAGKPLFLSMRQGGDGAKIADVLATHDGNVTYMGGINNSEAYRRCLPLARQLVLDFAESIKLLAIAICEFGILGRRAVQIVFDVCFPEEQ